MKKIFLTFITVLFLSSLWAVEFDRRFFLCGSSNLCVTIFGYVLVPGKYYGLVYPENSMQLSYNKHYYISFDELNGRINISNKEASDHSYLGKQYAVFHDGDLFDEVVIYENNDVIHTYLAGDPKLAFIGFFVDLIYLDFYKIFILLIIIFLSLSFVNFLFKKYKM